MRPERRWTARQAVDIDVDEKALGGGLSLVIAEQADLVAHRRSAELRHAQAGRDASGNANSEK